jgi:hypothetical protein
MGFSRERFASGTALRLLLGDGLARPGLNIPSFDGTCCAERVGWFSKPSSDGMFRTGVFLAGGVPELEDAVK